MGLLNGLFTRRGVRFVRTHSEAKTVPQTGQPGIFTYEIYTARTARRAREFLNGKTVTANLHYIVVETPEGTWGKSVEGLFRE